MNIPHVAEPLVKKEFKHSGVKMPENKKRKRWIIAGSIVAVLIIFRLFLPYIVLNYVNTKLSTLKEYYGHVEDVDLALIRGAYVINNINLVKKGNEQGLKDTVPFFRAPKIDLSVEWNAVFKGKLVGEIIVEKPVVNFVKGKHKGEDAKADTADFKRVVDDLMPLTVNKFEIKDGQIHYIDQTRKPRIDIAMKEVHVMATNLTNVNKENKLLPAHADATGTAYEGNFKLKVDFNALEEQPTFDMSTELTDVNLVQLNDFLQAYGNFDVKKGSFGLYAEFAAKNGEFGGYVKPMIRDMDVVQFNKEEGNVGQVLWEALIGSAAKLLENRKTDRIATKVDIKGKFDDPNINTWRAISFVIRNAFVHALKPTIDNTININNLEDDKNKTFLERIFGSGKKKNKKDKKNDTKKRVET
jgi:hypothetical protein